MPPLPSDERLVRTKFAQHLKGTRVELLKEILTWAEGDQDRRAFVLAADAGVGKSVVASAHALVVRRYPPRARSRASMLLEQGANAGEAGGPSDAARLAPADPEGHCGGRERSGAEQRGGRAADAPD